MAGECLGATIWRLCALDETTRHLDRRGVMAILWGNQRSSSCARVVTDDPPRLEGQSKSLLLAVQLHERMGERDRVS